MSRRVRKDLTLREAAAKAHEAGLLGDYHTTDYLSLEQLDALRARTRWRPPKDLKGLGYNERYVFHQSLKRLVPKMTDYAAMRRAYDAWDQANLKRDRAKTRREHEQAGEYFLVAADAFEEAGDTYRARRLRMEARVVAGSPYAVGDASRMRSRR